MTYVLSLNKPRFRVFTHCIYTKELEINDITYTMKLDLLLGIDRKGKLATKLYRKHYDSSFSVINFHIICSNISSAPGCVCMNF